MTLTPSRQPPAPYRYDANVQVIYSPEPPARSGGREHFHAYYKVSKPGNVYVSGNALVINHDQGTDYFPVSGIVRARVSMDGFPDPE